MQQALRRQQTIQQEQTALKRPHEEGIKNLHTILQGLAEKLAAEVKARDEVLATVSNARDKVQSDLNLVSDACAEVDSRIRRFNELVDRDAKQRRQAEVEKQGIALVLAEQKRKSRVLLEEIEDLRRTIVIQEQEVYDVKKAVKRIQENPQWEILGLQFMRQWPEDRDKRLAAMRRIYLQKLSHHPHGRKDHVPGKYRQGKQTSNTKS